MKTIFLKNIVHTELIIRLNFTTVKFFFLSRPLFWVAFRMEPIGPRCITATGPQCLVWPICRPDWTAHARSRDPWRLPDYRRLARLQLAAAADPWLILSRNSPVAFLLVSPFQPPWTGSPSFQIDTPSELVRSVSNL